MYLSDFFHFFTIRSDLGTRWWKWKNFFKIPSLRVSKPFQQLFPRRIPQLTLQWKVQKKALPKVAPLAVQNATKCMSEWSVPLSVQRAYLSLYKEGKALCDKLSPLSRPSSGLFCPLFLTNSLLFQYKSVMRCAGEPISNKPVPKYDNLICILWIHSTMMVKLNQILENFNFEKNRSQNRKSVFTKIF